MIETVVSDESDRDPDQAHEKQRQMILHIITDFSAPHGAQKMLARLLMHETSMPAVVVSLTDVSDANRKIAGNPLVRFESLHATSAASIFNAVFRLRNLIRQERPTVILCWMYHAMAVGAVAAKLARTGAPVYWNIRQSLDDPGSLTRNTRHAVAVCKHLSGLPKGTIYNSQRALVLHQKNGFRDHNSTVIPNGFEIADDATARLTNATTFGIAGRFHPQKDPRTLIDAAAKIAHKHPQVRFLMAGEGNTRNNPELMSMISEAGLPPDNVQLLGSVAEMAGFYQSIDALVLSSRTEGFPNVVAEAMSHGKPVVTTDVGDAAIIVGDTGLVVPPKDPGALNTAMEQLIALSPQEYRDLAERALARVRSCYSLETVGKQYRQFLGI
jgi:glycosyltransferase involved in cell wall biosynthesis